MRPDRRLIERCDLQREVIKIAPLFPRSSTAGAPELSCQWHEIDDRFAGTKLDQADIVAPDLDRAAKPIDIKVEAARQVRNAKHNMVKGVDSERDQFFIHFTTFI
jgi:uncharacterized protein YllA (UPF0747 family)